MNQQQPKDSPHPSQENEPPTASSSRAQNEPEVDGKRLCREDEPPVVSRLQDPELSSRRDPWLKENELSMEDTRDETRSARENEAAATQGQPPPLTPEKPSRLEDDSGSPSDFSRPCSHGSSLELTGQMSYVTEFTRMACRDVPVADIVFFFDGMHDCKKIWT